MRAPKNEATGTSGESEVLAQFERLGWGGVIDSRHDTGTDLYLRPRDARRYELGAVMGAQVKTGSSYFKSPQKDAEARSLGGGLPRTTVNTSTTGCATRCPTW